MKRKKKLILLNLFFTLIDLQSGQRLKILKTNQILRRLPISLAQLKAGNNSENLKMKLGKFYLLCTDQKRLTKQLYKILVETI